MRQLSNRVVAAVGALAILAGSSSAFAAGETIIPGSICHLINANGSNMTLAYNGTSVIGGSASAPYIYAYCPVPTDTVYNGGNEVVVEASYDVGASGSCWIMAGTLSPDTSDASLVNIGWTVINASVVYKNSGQDMSAWHIPILNGHWSQHPVWVVECRMPSGTARLHNIQMKHN